MNELAASTLLTLSGLETVLGKVSFGSLLTATSIYEYKVRHQTLDSRMISRNTTREGRYPNPHRSNATLTDRVCRFNESEPILRRSSRRRSARGGAEQFAMLGGNLALASLLAARWVESGHFPLSNMYESLLFLAWGITACT